jgi:PAS domain S-box-containing protein
MQDAINPVKLQVLRPVKLSTSPYAPSGLPAFPRLQWGSHLVQFFGNGTELRDLLVPYFKAGLENNERCLWVTGSAFNADQARAALRAEVSDLDKREREKQIEIANAGEWYASGEKLRPHDIVLGLLQREQEAVGLGYEGLRTNGNCAWVSADQWPDFRDYELLVHQGIRERRMICMCSYCMDQLQDGSHLDVMRCHDIVIPTSFPAPVPLREVKQPSYDLNSVDINSVLEALPAAIYVTDRDGYLTYYNRAAADLWGYRPQIGQQRWCGTWKIFLFDGTHVPHDQCPMAVALQTGEPVRGIEADAERPDGTRVPCAVYPAPLLGPDGTVVGGINMLVDISDRKAQEAKSTVVAREMRHRVNNTLAMVQAILGSTLRLATTMEDFRENFVKRIAALAKTHAMLTDGIQSSVQLRDLLRNELYLFADGDGSGVQLSGPEISISERVAVPLGMAIHELATNAAKYGALSLLGGKLTVDWTLADDVAHLEWRETNVPMPQKIKRIGFGTRLLTEVLPKQVGAKITIDYQSDGVKAVLSFPVR